MRRSHAARPHPGRRERKPVFEGWYPKFWVEPPGAVA
jgi:hypothetical protein